MFDAAILVSASEATGAGYFSTVRVADTVLVVVNASVGARVVKVDPTLYGIPRGWRGGGGRGWTWTRGSAGARGAAARAGPASSRTLTFRIGAVGTRFTAAVTS